jgi:hypothetical protein
MGDLFSGPHLFVILMILVAIPVFCYVLGFRNGKRKGQLIELQKRVNGK